jgi:hypothetical protein
MELKKKLISFLTPKNTEEVKPNLFIQKIRGVKEGNSPEDKYRQITPVAWDGKIINWTAFWLGANPVKSTLVFLLIIFMAWAYVHDMSARDSFYEKIIYNDTFAKDVCELHLEENLTRVYSFNVTHYCNEKLKIYRLEDINWKK